MTVERETAGFALPFAGGVILTAYTGHISGPVAGHLAAFICIAFAIIILMHPSRISIPRTAIIFLIATSAFFTGSLCGMTATILSVSHIPSEIAIQAERLGTRMQEAIDSLPFSDRTCNAIAKALITGERTDIPKNITEAFRNSGASHILALSGLHLGIIYAIVTRSLSLLGNKYHIKVARSFMTVLLCGIYTLATGAGPSITRAFLFILLAEAAKLTHRNCSTAQILWSALIIQLTISPLSVKSIGFQLSYAAMAGIAFIMPWMQAFWPGNIHNDRRITRFTRKIWNTAAMSISCQITTAPLAYFHFGTFPSYFLITNLIALPITGLIIPAILTSLILNSLGICPGFILSGTETLIYALIRSLEIISGLQTEALL